MRKNRHCVSTLIFCAILTCAFLVYYEAFVNTERINYSVDITAEIEIDTSDYNEKKNLNTASIEDLCEISGIGEKTATLIIEERERLGGFVVFEQVDAISGIGEQRLADIKSMFYIGT
ncbi:MAG: helix-hairpin-helix domain-containing protein [Clostridia bacterium]